MKVLLVLGVVLTISVALSSAQCYTDVLKTRQRVCEHKGTFHNIGDKWTSDCERCSCHKRGMECCQMIQTPVDYDKENCEAILHKESCSYTVTRKDNPSEECEIFGMIA